MSAGLAEAQAIAGRVEAFVRSTIVPLEKAPRTGSHGPDDAFVAELRGLARAAGVLTPYILPDGSHLSHRGTALVLRAAGLSPLGPLAVNAMAPDEGNMYLIGKVGSPEQKARFLAPLAARPARSAFFMTEPAAGGGAGSDPSMMRTTARKDGNGSCCSLPASGKHLVGADTVAGRSSPMRRLAGNRPNRNRPESV